MSGRIHRSEEFLDLVDGYCSGLIDEIGFHRLEAILLASHEARRYFAEYYDNHAMIRIAFRSCRATGAVLKQLDTVDRSENTIE